MPAEFVALADLVRAAEAAARPALVPVVVARGGDDAGSGSRAVGHHEVVRAEIGQHEETLSEAEAEAEADRVRHDESVFSAAVHPQVVAAAREARLFRARLADAFDDALPRLLRELAADVLARELRLAPCDVAAIARRVLERAPVVRVRISRADAACGEYGLPVVADPALRSGDAVFELDGGALDARLGVRLAAVLETEAVR